MQVSKWDLIMFTKLEAIKVKLLMKMLTGEKEPTQANIHQVMCSLILSRSGHWSHKDQLRRLFEAISFTLEVGQIQESEFRYLAHLMYHQIKVVTHYEMKSSQLEEQIVTDYFNLQSDQASIEDIIEALAHDRNLPNILHLFTKVPLRKRLGDSPCKSPINRKRTLIGDCEDSLCSNMTEMENFEGHDSKIVLANASIHESEPEVMAKKQSQKLLVDTIQDKSFKNLPINELIANQAGSINDGGMSNRTAGEPSVMQLHWNTYILSNITHDNSDDSDHEFPSEDAKHLTKDLCKTRHYYNMCEKVKLLQNAYRSRVSFADSQRTVDLRDVLKQIKDCCLDFYGYQQCNIYLKSLYLENQMLEQKFSVVQLIGHEPSNTAEIQEFEKIMIQHQAARLFKAVYSQHLPALKYQVKIHEATIVRQMMRRGERRNVEKQKHILLGEIRVLCDILDEAEVFLRYREELKAKILIDTNENASVNYSVEDESSPGLHRAMPVSLLETHKYKAGTQPEKEGRKQQTPLSIEENQKTVKNFPPDLHTILHRVRKEYNKLRNNNLSRKDLVLFQDIKRQKIQNKRIIGYWMGVQKALQYVMQLPTFAEIGYFRDALHLVTRTLASEERKYNKILESMKEQKRCLHNYYRQLGIFKSIDFLMTAKESVETGPYPQTELFWYFVGEIQTKLSQATNEMENVDVKLVKLTSESIFNQRAHKMYFKAQGQISAYKVIKNALKFEYIYDYMALHLAKMRLWESWTLCSQSRKTRDPLTTQQHSSQSTDLLTSLYSLKYLLSLDENFNQQDQIQSQEMFEFDRYVDEVKEDAEEERKAVAEVRELPDIGSCYRPDLIKDSTKKMARTLLTAFYNRVCSKKVASEKVDAYNSFAREGLENGVNDEIKSTMNFQGYDLEDAANTFFDFVEIEENTHLFEKDEFVSESGDTIVHWMGTLSVSMRHFDVIKRTKEVRDSFQQAHRNCKAFLAQLLEESKDDNYREVLRKHLLVTLKKMISLLLQTNSGSLINNMDNTIFSMPLEYSPLVNLNLISCLTKMLKEAQIQSQIKFRLMNKPDILARRSNHFLRYIPQYANSLGLFFAGGTLSELRSPEVENEPKIVTSQIRSIYVSEPELGRQVRQETIGGISEIIGQLETQASIEVDEMTRILAGKVRDEPGLRDYLMKRSQAGDLPLMLQEYANSRHQHCDLLRHMYAQESFRGAREFMEETNEKWNWHDSLIVEKLLKYTKSVEEQVNERMKEMSKKTTQEVTNKDAKEKESAIIELMVRIQISNKFLTTLSQNKDTKYVLKRIKKTKNQRKEFLGRMGQLQQYLLVNLNEKKDPINPRIELRSCLPHTDKQRLKGRKLIFNILNRQLIFNTFLYKPWCTAVEKKRFDQSKTFTKIKKVKNEDFPEMPEQKAKKLQSLASPLAKSGMPKEDQEAGSAFNYYELSGTQIAANMFMNFINQSSSMDFRVASKLPNETDRLFSFVNMMVEEVDARKDKINMHDNLKKSFDHLLDVYEIEKVSIDVFNKRYTEIGKFVSSVLQKEFEEKEEGQLQFQFFNIMSSKGSALLKQYQNKIESYLWLMDLDDEDKIAGTAAVDYFKQVIERRLVPFKKFIDDDQSVKAVQKYENSIEFKKMRIYQELAAMISLVRIYYLKKDQDRSMNVAREQAFERQQFAAMELQKKQAREEYNLKKANNDHTPHQRDSNMTFKSTN